MAKKNVHGFPFSPSIASAGCNALDSPSNALAIQSLCTVVSFFAVPTTTLLTAQPKKHSQPSAVTLCSVLHGSKSNIVRYMKPFSLKTISAICFLLLSTVASFHHSSSTPMLSLKSLRNLRALLQTRSSSVRTPSPTFTVSGRCER